MPSNIKRQHTPAFKVSVALELLKETNSLSQICSQYSIHPTQARNWKIQAIQVLQNGFTNKPVQDLARKDELISELYRQIGQLKVEFDWLKKKMGYPTS
jgi:putative transposase